MSKNADKLHHLTPRLPIFKDSYYPRYTFSKPRFMGVKVTHRGEDILEVKKPEFRAKGNAIPRNRWEVEYSFYDIPEEFIRTNLPECEGGGHEGFYVTNGFILSTINNLGLNGYESAEIEISVLSPMIQAQDILIDRKLFYHLEYHGETFDSIEMSDSREFHNARDVNEVMGYRDMTSRANRKNREQHRQGRRAYIESLSLTGDKL